MGTKYDEMIEVIAAGDMGEFDRGDILIREMCKLMETMLNYKYIKSHYDDKGTTMEDKINEIKNAMSVVTSDMDVYAEQLSIRNAVHQKAYKRVDKIYNKIREN